MDIGFLILCAVVALAIAMFVLVGSIMVLEADLIFNPKHRPHPMDGWTPGWKVLKKRWRLVVAFIMIWFVTMGLGFLAVAVGN
ncbi:hypothetical protein [Notoacmeibacter sp. MSK16QG-6]|uniref:hypothetical protein n=1 Tax=Notoacmeibacter sp. MSK16QG-6 TaxID=2957982 RepID=UPI0020A09A9F|nr:hypothetical protein [Notoacmeibacter sp. MSK16QG-6]